MDNEDPEPVAPSTEAAGATPEPPTNDPGAGEMTRTEARLRRLSGRKGAYDGPLVAVARGWVSHDSRFHFLSARFLDFAVLTPDHLVLCSTGFFTRRPRRRVLRESLNLLQVTPLGSEPTRCVRVAGSFNHPIRLEMRPNEAGMTFVRELLACTRTTPSS